MLLGYAFSGTSAAHFLFEDQNENVAALKPGAGLAPQK
jgi:hypothetical protein